LEELGRHDDVRSLRARVANEPLDPGDVFGAVAAEGRLDCCDGDPPLLVCVVLHGSSARDKLVGSCCVMQWNAPPPPRIDLASIPTTRREGKSAPIRSTAASSCGEPYVGTTTA